MFCFLTVLTWIGSQTAQYATHVYCVRSIEPLIKKIIKIINTRIITSFELIHLVHRIEPHIDDWYPDLLPLSLNFELPECFFFVELLLDDIFFFWGEISEPDVTGLMRFSVMADISRDLDERETVRNGLWVINGSLIFSKKKI